MPGIIHNLILTAYRTGLVPNPMKKALETGRVIRQRPSKKHVEKIGVQTDEFDGSRVHTYGTPKDGDPILYFCHGGGFLIGMIHPYFDFIGWMQKAADLPAIVPDYPMPVETNAEGMQAWVNAHFRSVLRQYPNSPIILAGDSAGAHMALRLTQELASNERKSIAGLYSLFGWLDLTREQADYPDNKEEVLLRADVIGEAIDRFRGDIPAGDPRISPLFGDLSDLPPTRIITGDKDMLHAESIALNARLREAEIDPKYKVYQGYAHDFIMFPSPDGKRGIREIAAMMKTDLQRS